MGDFDAPRGLAGFLELYAGTARLSGALLDVGARVGPAMGCSLRELCDLGSRWLQRLVRRWASR
eukprot:7423309-Pyramimonas_sp.AAC.1